MWDGIGLPAIHAVGALIGGMLAVMLPAPQTMAFDGETLVARQCASCHNLAGPAPSTFGGVLKRRAPDLFYAGSKFNRPWLVEWLQNPTVIRPSGVMYLNHIVNANGKDRIETDTVRPCAARLSPDEAEAVADYLMTRKDPALKSGVVDASKPFRKPKAFRLFSKQLPCIGCHTIRFGKRTRGGVSGPDLTRAGARLNPDWVYAKIDNPQYWDPKTWMPRIEMSHKKREMLSLFVASMK